MSDQSPTPEVPDVPPAPVPSAPPAASAPVPPAPAPMPPAPASSGMAYAPSGVQVPVFPNGKPMLDAAGNPVSEKSRLAAALLCWFLGIIGIHRFYVGKVGTGIAMIVTLGGLGIWALVDFIMILMGSFRDKAGKPLANW